MELGVTVKDRTRILKISEDERTYETLLEKIRIEFSSVLQQGGNISFIEIFNKDWNKFFELRPEEVGTSVKDKCQLRVNLKLEDGEARAFEPLPEDHCKVCFERQPMSKQEDKVVRGSSAIFPNDQLWDKTQVWVCFLNQIPSSWTYSGHNYPIPGASAGHVMERNDVLALANMWSTRLPPSIPKEKREKVPQFVPITDPMQSDIRVWFRTSGGCSSEVGTKALDITKGDKEENATMFLNLSGNDRHKEHLVMHEFGHALGLGHEHQRAVFWDNIGKFFKKDVVEKFFNSFTSFQTDGASLGNTPGIRSEKYDPHSIMHYWVKSEWLLDKYNSLQKVNGSPDLNNKEKEILEGFFKRVGCLAEELSPTDLESIAEAYYSKLATNGTRNGSGGTAVQSAQAAPTTPVPSLSQLDVHYLKAIQNQVFDVRSKWRLFGLELDVTAPTLDAIGATHFYKPNDCLPAVLNHWLQREKTFPAFPALLAALRAVTVGFGYLAQRLESLGEEEKEKIGFYL